MAEVVAEKNVFIGRHVVQTVIVDYGRCSPTRIELHHIVSDEQAVVAVCDKIDSDGCDNDPQGVDRLASTQCHYAQGARSYDCQQQPG